MDDLNEESGDRRLVAMEVLSDQASAIQALMTRGSSGMDEFQMFTSLKQIQSMNVRVRSILSGGEDHELEQPAPEPEDVVPEPEVEETEAPSDEPAQPKQEAPSAMIPPTPKGA